MVKTDMKFFINSLLVSVDANRKNKLESNVISWYTNAYDGWSRCIHVDEEFELLFLL